MRPPRGRAPGRESPGHLPISWLPRQRTHYTVTWCAKGDHSLSQKRNTSPRQLRDGNVLVPENLYTSLAVS